MLSKKEIDEKIRPVLSRIKAYKPVEPPEVLSQRVSIPRDEIIKMDANENPYGCSPAVKIALASYQHYNSYPDPEQRELRTALMTYTGAPVHNILAGSGSDELIELILRLFLEPGDNVLNCPPTFGTAANDSSVARAVSGVLVCRSATRQALRVASKVGRS